MSDCFDLNCIRCLRLVALRKEVARDYPGYHAAPVPSFGDPGAALLIVGLAPGMHGANASGRPFTGDHAGILLYETLHRQGFASHPQSVSADDDLKLRNCRITNAVKCLPPQNKPVGAEVNRCNSFLAAELSGIRLIIALGGIAHRAVIKAKGLKQGRHKFGHAAEHALGDGSLLLDSYHCSRYNTQTKRLTESMFNGIFERANELLTNQ